MGRSGHVRALEHAAELAEGATLTEASKMSTTHLDALLGPGHEGLARGDWRAARAAFEAAVAAGESPEALEGLAMASWWLDDVERVFQTRERAYRLYRARGDRRGAGRVALTIAMDVFHFRGQVAVAKGWLRRARSLLDGLAPVSEHAWIRLCECEIALATGEDAARARAVAAEAAEIGRAIDDADVEMTALSLEGLALVAQGMLAEGMPRLDEAATAALAGEVTDPVAVCLSCCHVVTACEAVRDFGRAAEWCARVREYSARVKFDLLLTVCRAQHASVLIWLGDWSEAERELQRLLRQLGDARPAMRQEAVVRLAELRRRQGRLDDAEALLAGVDWHPPARLVRAAIALDRGDAAAAADLARRGLQQAPRSNLTDRAAARELLLRAELALGTTPEPRALEEIAELAARVGTEALRAAALLAKGLLAAAGGEHEHARGAFEDALALFAGAGAVYEAARARVDLARALMALGRADAAAAELARAAGVFDALGAAGALRMTRALLKAARGHAVGAAAAVGPIPGGLSPRELEVVELLARGLTNARIAKRLGVSAFTIKRHVANILAKLGLPTRAAAAAFAARAGAGRVPG
jgi:LuxR family transcriptional regulator, maltose regulon positive regulatory protein